MTQLSGASDGSWNETIIAVIPVGSIRTTLNVGRELRHYVKVFGSRLLIRII